MRQRSVLAWLGVVFLNLSLPAAAQTSTEDLKRLSLQQILDIKVTTVSRNPEAASSVPAAVFVITGEDIRRSGATSIPEALRLAPGVQVARINAGTWSIGIRGFADRLSRAVLVLIDGRAVYSPLFAGTYWEAQDTLLSDIDRIEVIRGPGGTLWGANAVDGIINIITKAAAETQGLVASAGAGSEERAYGSVRYGGKKDALTYRAYAKAFDREPEFHSVGDHYDQWRAGQAGFRGDWALTGGRSFTLEGDAYDGRLGERPTLSFFTPPFSQTSNVDAPLSGGNVIGRLASAPADRDGYQLQVYYDRTNRTELPVGEDRDTVDADFQQTLRRWTRQTITWGTGYRVTSGRISAVPPTAFTPSTRTDTLFSGFVQDEIAVVPERWRVTFGSKIEHNAYSGVEVQPTARILWTPQSVNTFWGAVTRAVRTPSRVETDYTTASFLTPSPLPTFVRLEPNPGFIPEELIAYEAGYRVRPASRAYATASVFFNDLQHTLSTELLSAFVETTPQPAHLVLPVDFANGLHGHSVGGEATADVRPSAWWRVTANYSYINVRMAKNAGSHDVSQLAHYEGSVPHHQIEAGSSFDVRRWSIDWFVRYVSALKQPVVPAYTTSDLRVAYQPSSHLELALVGQDLFEPHHLEWPSGTGGNVYVARSLYARLTWSH